MSPLTYHGWVYARVAKKIAHHQMMCRLTFYRES